jgi:PAS domain S-box-containing protein
MTHPDSLSRFQNLFELIGDPVVEFEIIDNEPIVRTLNPAFVEVFGYDPDDMVGDSLNEFIVPPEAGDEATRFDQRTADGKYNSGVVTRLTADGPRDFLYRGIPYERDNREFGFAIYTDITERNKRKQKLQQQKQRLEQFAEVISHDIRNPLNVAKGRAEMLDQEHADIIARNLDRIEDIIDDVLTVVWTGQPVDGVENIQIADIATQCWGHVETNAATLTIADDPRIQADSDRFKQLLENLFRNAIEHGGADVTITVGTIGSDGIFVADDGTGIPPENRDEVFNRGYSTATDGTGLGLSIVQGICDAHGWEVTVTSSKDGGARFEITEIGVIDTS